MARQEEKARDVVVAGGGAAGLSAVLMLAGARRRVRVVDAGAPRNAPADGGHAPLLAAADLDYLGFHPAGSFLREHRQYLRVPRPGVY